jgi:hypothetical protein
MKISELISELEKMKSRHGDEIISLWDPNKLMLHHLSKDSIAYYHFNDNDDSLIGAYILID